MKRCRPYRRLEDSRLSAPGTYTIKISWAICMAWWVAQNKHSVRNSQCPLLVGPGKFPSRFEGSPLLPFRLAAYLVACWQPASHQSPTHPAPKGLATYLLVCLWCWMTMFFSWIVSNRAVARDFRSEMDCGVAGRLHPWSSDNRSWTRRDIKCTTQS